MPPTPQPSTPSPLTIVVWLSVPTRLSGNATFVAVDLTCLNDTGEEFEVDLVNDARSGWNDAKIIEGLLAPAQKLVAFAIALEFEPGIDQQAHRSCRMHPRPPNGRSPDRRATTG